MRHQSAGQRDQCHRRGHRRNAGYSDGHYLVLDANGKLTAWGDSGCGETNVSALSNSFVTAIAASYQHSLASVRMEPSMPGQWRLWSDQSAIRIEQCHCHRLRDLS